MGKHKQVEIKQHATKRPMGQQRNQRRNQKITQDKWKLKHTFPKCMGWSKSSSNREVNSNTGLPQEIRKISNSLTYHL